MSTVLVTGAAGFIGSHLVDRLLADGHQVVAVDNLATGRLDNLRHHLGDTRLMVAIADVADVAAMTRLAQGCERVYHLAALADIVPSVQRPLDYHRANVDGTVSVLEAARAAGIKRIIYAASSSCYGLPDVTPTPETAPVRPQYPYALTKWMGEQAALHWGQVYGMSVTSLRFFNVYGPRHRSTGAYGAVFGVFLAQKLAGQPYTVVGDGTQTRDFTYVTDVVRAVAMAADADLPGEVLNVGSGGTYSINQLVGLLGGPVTYLPKRPGEPACTFADTTRIATRLGWRPEVAFTEGVGRMLSHIEDWRAAPVWTPESIAGATKDWFRFLGGR